jgi:hypothetical protein
MNENEEGKAPIAMLDNAFAPELFASEAIGFFSSNGVVTVTFGALHIDYSKSPNQFNRTVVARLTMPTASAHALAVGLFDFLKQRGLMPDPPPNQAN